MSMSPLWIDIWQLRAVLYTKIMQKEESRSKRVSGRLQPSLYKSFDKFCKGKKWSESIAIEEAIIQLIRKWLMAEQQLCDCYRCKKETYHSKVDNGDGSYSWVCNLCSQKSFTGLVIDYSKEIWKISSMYSSLIHQLKCFQWLLLIRKQEKLLNSRPKITPLMEMSLHSRKAPQNTLAPQRIGTYRLWKKKYHNCGCNIKKIAGARNKNTFNMF